MAAASIFDFADKFGVTNTFGNWLPSGPTTSKKLTVTLLSVAYDQDDGYTIMFKVTTTGLAGQIATATLLPADAEPSPGVEGRVRQLLRLTDGTQRLTLRLAGQEFPEVLGPPPQNFYLLVSCGEQQAATADFSFLKYGTSCDCGASAGAVFSCQKPYSEYGPVFWGRMSARHYNRWEELIAAGKATTDEQLIISIMSVNEGNFDAIQSYDNQAVTVGAMQKTINLQGSGELAQQLYEFSQDNPALYASLLGDCGWEVRKQNGTYLATYTDPATNIKYTGKSLQQKIREGNDQAHLKKKLKNSVLAPFIKLGQNDEFQDKQVIDFIDRLRHKVLPLKPGGYTATVGEYLQSNIGRVVALDHHVNRPGCVRPWLAAALTELIKGERYDGTTVVAHPEISPDPSKWGTHRMEYEKLLLEIYGPLRELLLPGYPKSFKMTDGKLRYERSKLEFKQAGFPF